MTNRTFKSLYSLPSPVNAYCVIVEELNGSVNWLPDNDESMAFSATQRKLMKPKCALSWSSSTDNIQNMKPVLAIFSEISTNSKANYNERRQWCHLYKVTFLFFWTHFKKLYYPWDPCNHTAGRQNSSFRSLLCLWSGSHLLHLRFRRSGSHPFSAHSSARFSPSRRSRWHRWSGRWGAKEGHQ